MNVQWAVAMYLARARRWALVGAVAVGLVVLGGLAFYLGATL